MKLFAPLRQALFASMVVLLGLPALAQVPDQCLEIESILVDACIDLNACQGASEGQNEMVRFRTGAVAIALTELEADWPNNSWNGLVQDANTAALTVASGLHYVVVWSLRAVRTLRARPGEPTQ